MALFSFSQTQGKPSGSFGLRNLFQPKLPQVPLLGAQASPAPLPQQKPQVGESSPQIAAIQAALGGLKTQAQGIQAGLGNVQQQQSIGDRLRPIAEGIGGLYAPSQQENDVRSKLANLLSARDKGLVQAEEQAVPLQAILGEQGRIERRAFAGAIPLQDQLAQLQAERTGKLEAEKFRFGAEQDIMKNQRDQEIFQRPDETKVSEFTNEKGEQVIAFRNNKTGAVRQEVLGNVQAKSSESSQLRQAKASGISRARPLLMAARGSADFANTYLDLRSQYAEAFGDARDFDQVFAPFLSEEDRKALLGGAGTLPRQVEDDSPWS